MGILPSGAASDRIIARPELLWPVPSYWSLEDAVTVPSAYLHALYCYVSICATILLPSTIILKIYNKFYQLAIDLISTPIMRSTEVGKFKFQFEMLTEIHLKLK